MPRLQIGMYDGKRESPSPSEKGFHQYSSPTSRTPQACPRQPERRAGLGTRTSPRLLAEQSVAVSAVLIKHEVFPAVCCVIIDGIQARLLYCYNRAIELR